MGLVEQLAAARLVHAGERLDVRARAEQQRVGRGDDERALLALDLLPHAREGLDDLGRQRVGRRVVQPGDRVAVARLELHGALRALVRARPREEALAGLLAQTALGDQPAQDRRRREAVAVLLL